MKTLLTTAQAARELNLSVERIRQLAAKGVLPSVTTPLGRLFDREDVNTLKLARTESASPAGLGLHSESNTDGK